MEHNEKQSIMERFLHQKLITPFIAVLLVIGFVVITAAACLFKPPEIQTNEALYKASVADAVIAEEDELLPLVTITPDSAMTTWKDGKVLLLTVNNKPERYVEATPLKLPGEVWTFTDKELTAWYNENKKGVTDWTLRLKQLVGVPPDKEYTHVSAMWVSPEDVLRPAYKTDIKTDTMQTTLPEETPEAYKEWFEDNIMWSYFDSAYPWTRLGYTYDWAPGSDEYGLTEFWVRPGATVTVEFTDTIDEFIKRLEQEANKGEKE